MSLVPVESGFVVTLDDESIFAVAPQDLDPLSSETVATVAEEAAARLQLAVNEAVELRNPRLLLEAAARTAVATLLFFALIAVLNRLRLRLEAPLLAVASERISSAGFAGRLLSYENRLERWLRRLLVLVLAAIGLAACYAWVGFSLRQFPYTRPWGEVLRQTLLGTLVWMAHGIADAMPGLFTVALIVLFTRLLARGVRVLFDALQDGRIRIVGFDPDVARPTRQLVVVVLWIFALVVSYPYLPGSGSEAFRGISVFLGIVLSLGSTGIVNQGMSGLILMYSAALKPGEYVRVGDVEGTVMHLGMLSTRIRTLHRELVTVPNSVMVMRETINYSRLANNGVAIKTGLTLGYDVPWRQVHAVLRLAAQRTEGVRDTPEPMILQDALSDFYVSYRLIAYIDEPRTRPRRLSELHGHILDLCNEHGIQILSPHYVGDPDEPAIVPRERWSTPPAEPGQRPGPLQPAAE